LQPLFYYIGHTTINDDGKGAGAHDRHECSGAASDLDAQEGYRQVRAMLLWSSMFLCKTTRG
jgi:hypothetical protein